MQSQDTRDRATGHLSLASGCAGQVWKQRPYGIGAALHSMWSWPPQSKPKPVAVPHVLALAF
jgi:hypothetical protein